MSRPKILSVALYPKQQGENYRADNETELLSGYVEIFPGNSEVEIRKIFTKLFRTSFTLISDKDYDFVKRIRNVISKPVTPDDFEWNFEAIKVLAGQRKLCCQLTVDENCLVYEDYPDLDCIFSKSCFENEASHSTPFQPVPVQLSQTSSNLASYFQIHIPSTATSHPTSSPLAPSIDESTTNTPIAPQISRTTAATSTSTNITATSPINQMLEGNSLKLK